MAPVSAPGSVLQVSTANMNKQNAGGKSASKASAPRTKVVIRRLPPGLSETELKDALGDEWKAGKGKVDWINFKPGKVSKE